MRELERLATIAARVLADVATGQPVQDPRTDGAAMPDLSARPDPLTVPWYPVINDLIGGWAIATADMPLSEIDTRRWEVLVVGEFADEAIARRIAELHNASLRQEATR